jgi:SAM-dependent methyltransferase
MYKKIMKKLACPACVAEKKSSRPLLEAAGEDPGLRCPGCGSLYRSREGIIDFVGDAPGRAVNSSQRAMEFRPLVALYERFWRPMITMPFSNLAWEMETAHRFLELAPRHDVLDIACGPGNFTRPFADTARDGAVVGIDLSLPMLLKGAAMLRDGARSNIALMRVDVTRWPFTPNSFDRVHTAGALHLFPRLEEVFRSIERSLKPGGIFVGATYIRGGSAPIRAIQKFVSSPLSFHWFTPTELASLAAGAGFTGWEMEIRKQGIVFRVKKK